jgi:hypothetical protein
MRRQSAAADPDGRWRDAETNRFVEDPSASQFFDGFPENIRR